MKKKEYIAYQGAKYTIEWFYNMRGRSQALEYAENMTDAQKAKLLVVLECMGDIGQLRNKTKFRSEGQKIYAFKLHPDRFLCFFFRGKKIIITNAFCKKQDKLPKRDKEKALDNMTNYIERVKKGDYYD